MVEIVFRPPTEFHRYLFEPTGPSMDIYLTTYAGRANYEFEDGRGFFFLIWDGRSNDHLTD